MGVTVVIRHEDGYTSSYACLAEEVAVKPGDVVTMGQAIGAVGQTALMESAIGHHLHFSVTLNDESISPADFLSIGK
jgi:murein DD-endopeptidase MepM/ murein hydrolase activator NlpD